jgi:ribosomal protein S18 acetylase RimI-like enzyme
LADHLTDRELIRALEERLVNLWPSVETLLMDGWAVRFANGYSGRANSASAVVLDAALTPELLAEFERLYRRAGLRPSVRVTPVSAPGAEALLAASGYRVKDRSRIMTLDLADRRGARIDARIALDASATPAWCAAVSARQTPDKRDPDRLMAIVGRIRLPVGFASLSIDGEAVGFGMCAIDRGWAELGSIVLDPAHRGRGHGRTLVEGLLAFAAGQGASAAFLQVDAANAAALALYRGLGFEDRGGYATMVRD